MSNRFDIKAKLSAPASKSLTQRAIAAAMLAQGLSTIRHPSACDDALAALAIAAAFGAQISEENDEWHIAGCFQSPDKALCCNESALCARLFSPIAALLDTAVEITGSGTLLRRPMNEVSEAIMAFGGSVVGNNYVPMTVKGPLQSRKASIDASKSSQVLSGLLMALPLLPGDSEVMVEKLVSRQYVDLTIELLHAFGIVIENNQYQSFFIKGSQRYLPQTYTVEGDWSGAAFWLVVAAIGGTITVSGLREKSWQPDKAILQVLQATGALVTWVGDELTVCKGELRPFSFDATECPDLFPPLVLLAAFCRGHSVIEGAGRLLHKESNRAIALQETFGKMGVQITIENNTLIVHGGVVHGAKVSSFHDHRIAMAAVCAGLFTTTSVDVDDTNCIKKSYPEFMQEIQRLQMGR